MGAATVLAAVVALAACGGGGESKVEAVDARPAGVTDDVVRNGEEASKAELEQAARALRRFLDTIAVGDWRAACAEMAPSTVEQLERVAAKSSLGRGCSTSLAKLARLHSPQSLKADARRAVVRALRVDGSRAIAVYRGREGTLLAMPMARRGGLWRPAAMAGTPLPGAGAQTRDSLDSDL